jgi:hypothetical protein
MTEVKTVLRWLGRAAMLQCALIFLVHFVLTKRLSTVRDGLTDALYRSQITTDQVQQMNQALFSISSLIVWIFMSGIVSTVVGYGFLRSIIVKKWPTNPLNPK